MVSKLILIGGGGHCHACIDVIESTQKFQIIGIIDIQLQYLKKLVAQNGIQLTYSNYLLEFLSVCVEFSYCSMHHAVNINSDYHIHRR